MLFSVCSVSADGIDYYMLEEEITAAIEAEVNPPEYTVYAAARAAVSADYPIVEGNTDISYINCYWYDADNAYHQCSWKSGYWQYDSSSDYWRYGYGITARSLYYTVYVDISQGSQVNLSFSMYMDTYSWDDYNPVVKIEGYSNSTWFDVTDWFTSTQSSTLIRTWRFQSDSIEASIDAFRVTSRFNGFENNIKPTSVSYLLAKVECTVYNDAETQLGILDTIGDILEKISNLPEEISNFIFEKYKEFLVPSSDEILELVTDFTDKTSENLGFISQSYSFVFDILLDISEISNNSSGTIEFPGVSLPINGETYVLIEKQDVKIDPFAGTDLDLIGYVRIVTSVIVTLGVINWGWKDFENLISVKTTTEGE